MFDAWSLTVTDGETEASNVALGTLDKVVAHAHHVERAAHEQGVCATVIVCRLDPLTGNTYPVVAVKHGMEAWFH